MSIFCLLLWKTSNRSCLLCSETGIVVRITISRSNLETGFFKGKKKMSDHENEGNDGSDSDSDDEDFTPNEANEEGGSEESSDDDVEDPESKKKTDNKKTGKTSRKRGAPKRSARNGLVVRSKRGKFEEDEDDSFQFHKARTNEDDDADLPNAEEKEADEKAETDRLWADFQASVEEAKKKKSKDRTNTTTKVVEKIYDFAGEKVSVQEKVTVTVSSSSNRKDDSNPPPTPSTSSLSLLPRNNTTPTKNGGTHAEPKPGPSSAVSNETKPKPARRRGGISILGNDPEAIGLHELDKGGLSGLLKAFKQHKSTKIGTLEKSKLDWETYKRQQGLEEELQSHTKSRDTFIDKQEFLQRTDHRQFEIEKSMRATARSKRLAK